MYRFMIHDPLGLDIVTRFHSMAYAAADSNKIHTDVLTKARETCYKARGAFYACLKKESNKNLTEIAYVGLLYPLECKQCRNEYVNRCRFSWVKHFDRQYCRNTRVQTLFDHMTGPYIFKPYT
ncbi:Cytochrome c oxidase [Vigna unguiculata]|uniref:Cytochrome c oxidase n=1 Tax=Vigna unguiculata TaxID=3917 RepID=A0A4D6KS68_VIGUN|nr:Cytochrome c oxidase [Vigna unguiculata]